MILSRGDIGRELAALRAAIAAIPLWLHASLDEVRFRYRRTYLGPLWITLSMAFLMVSLGLLYSGFFESSVSVYLPYVGVSLISWRLISGIATDSSLTLSTHRDLIRNIPLPIGVFALRVVAHNLVVFGHNVVILPFVYLLWPEYVNWNLLLLLPGLGLFCLNALPIALALSLLGGRFRDIDQIVTNLMVVAFFLTPVFWLPEAVGDRIFVVEWNPLYHLIELLRSPLLGKAPGALSWIVSSMTAAIAWVAALRLSQRYRQRIPYFV